MYTYIGVLHNSSKNKIIYSNLYVLMTNSASGKSKSS